MSIGENIYRLRTQKNLSQGALADMLDVSRQSVSKWETENAVPDLDKLIKMCEIFEISMDELTLRTENTKPPAPITTTLSHAQIIGYILLAATLFGGILSIVSAATYLLWVLIMPMAVLSTVCLKVKRHTAYWATWTIINALGVYMVSVFGSILYLFAILVPGYIAMYFYTKKEFSYEATEKSISTKSMIVLFASDILVFAGWYMFRHSGLYQKILATEIRSIYSITWFLYSYGFAVTCIISFCCLSVAAYLMCIHIILKHRKR